VHNIYMPMDFNLVGGGSGGVGFDDDGDMNHRRSVSTKSIIKYFQYKGIVDSYTQGVVLVVIITLISATATWYITKEFALLPSSHVGLYKAFSGEVNCPPSTRRLSKLSNSKTTVCVYERR
jgi:hypothetical protein